MKIEKVNINELISPSYNPREISPEEMEKLKTSIEEFGYVAPIIVNEVNNHIVGGNQRCLALKQLGYTMIDVIYINEPDINKEKALNIRLNNLSGEWDMTKLEKVIDELKMEKFDITLTGFEIDNVESFDDLEVNNIPFNETITSDLNTGLKEESEENLPENDFFTLADDNTPTENEQIYSPDEIIKTNLTFELKEGDEWKFGNNTLKIGKLNNKRYSIKIDFDTVRVTFEKIKNGTENPVQEFLDDNTHLQDKIRHNGHTDNYS